MLPFFTSLPLRSLFHQSPCVFCAVTLLETTAYTLYEGEKLELKCRSKEEPQEVNWTKDQVSLADGEHTHLRDGQLEIEGVELADSGLYGCFARSPEGNHTEYFNVNVTCKQESSERFSSFLIKLEPVCLIIIIFLFVCLF